MPELRCYIKPFDTLGNYLDDFIEVTSDVDIKGLGTLSQKLDNNSFEVGIFSYGDVTLKLSNVLGKYSEAGQPQSIFSFKRSNSIFKITWNDGSQFDAICGFAVCGSGVMSSEVTVFEGLINDDVTSIDIAKQTVSFKVLSYESIFDQVETPFASISGGDLISTVIDTCLDQTEITSLMSLVISNINPATDQALDNVTDLENTTVKEALDILLEASNSILFLSEGNIIVSDRSALSPLAETFYGQASNDGIENILKLSNIRTGRNKMFNYWTWEDTTLLKSDTTSVQKNGLRKKEIGFSVFTDTTKRNNILSDAKDAFKDSKKEITVTTTMNESHLSLEVRQKVNIDYPTVFFTSGDGVIPLYGSSVYGSAEYPIGQWGTTIETTDYYKILGRKVNLKNHTIDLILKEI